MSARWLSEALLKETLGPADSLALLQALGGLSFYVPKTCGPARILGRDLHKLLSFSGLKKLVELAGGETVQLPNHRRAPASLEVRRLLRLGLSSRQIADAMRLSLRYVESLRKAERSDQQHSLF